jgi:hypothetical protein
VLGGARGVLARDGSHAELEAELRAVAVDYDDDDDWE